MTDKLRSGEGTYIAPHGRTRWKHKIDFEKLSVNTHQEIDHWISLLDTVVKYHRDLAEIFEPERDSEEIKQIHTAWANAVADAAVFISTINQEDRKGKEFILGVKE